jgi:hypothetical protein
MTSFFPHRSMTQTASGFQPLSLLLLLSLAGLTACSSPPPDQELQAAEMSITNAENARVADYASPELGQARDKLAAAKAAVSEGNMMNAKRLAEQAQIDAQLATAKASAAKAAAVNTDMKNSTETLKSEMDRNQGGTL